MDEEEIGLGPTPERLSRGPVELLERAQDEEGRPSRPHRAIDILAILQARKAITREMWMAGYDFRNLFDRAHLDPLGCADVSRPMVSGRRKPSALLPSRIENARQEFAEAVDALGGPRAEAGSCMVNVIGWGMTIRDWCHIRFREGYPRISQQEATGVIRSALGVLVKHFEESS